MKKMIKITLAILFASLFIGMSFVKADYACTVGTVNTYEVNDSEWDFTVGANSSSGTGYSFEEAKFAEGTQFTVEVTSASATTVGYEVAVGTKSDTGTATSLDLIGVIFLLFYPLLLAGGVSGTWNQTETDLGPGLQSPFFVEPEAAGEFFYELSNETFVSSEFTDPEWTFTEIGGSFDNDTDIAVFEWTLDARYSIGASNTDFSGTYSYMLAYDQTTGETMGWRIDLDYTGTIEGSLLEMDLLQEVEMLGYNLPAGGIFGGFIPGFEWFVAIPALALLGLISIAIKRRK